MTYKQIEQAREIRLWITQIIVPTTVVVSTLASIPEVRFAAKRKFEDVKESIKKKKFKTM